MKSYNGIEVTMMRRIAAVTTLALIAASHALPAQASMVDIDKNAYHDSVFVLGSDLHLTDIHSSSAGTVTVRLADIAFTDVLQSLSASLSRLGKPLLTETGPGRLTFDIQKDEVMSLGIYALAGGNRKYGLYTLDLSFTPIAAQVPVPAAGLLLLSGLGLIPALRRRRRHEAAAR